MDYDEDKLRAVLEALPDLMRAVPALLELARECCEDREANEVFNAQEGWEEYHAGCEAWHKLKKEVVKKRA
jgi:hypothetical protein